MKKKSGIGTGPIHYFSEKEAKELNERMEKAFDRIRRECAVQQTEAIEAAKHIYFNI